MAERGSASVQRDYIPALAILGSGARYFSAGKEPQLQNDFGEVITNR